MGCGVGSVQIYSVPLSESFARSRLKGVDTIQVWNNLDALDRVFNSTPSKVLISWYTVRYCKLMYSAFYLVHNYIEDLEVHRGLFRIVSEIQFEPIFSRKCISTAGLQTFSETPRGASPSTHGWYAFHYRDCSELAITMLYQCADVP